MPIGAVGLCTPAGFGKAVTQSSLYLISGVTRDANGSALGGCVVEVFETASNLFRGSTISDASGNYAIEIAGNRSLTFFVVAYLAGSPDVAGATINTLFAGVGAEAAAFLARTTGLDATHTNAYTALINGLVMDGIWARLDMLHVYATQDQTTALLNLVSTSYNGIANGSPTFTADRGFTGTAASSTVYIDTQLNPTSGPSQYTLNSGHISAWSVADIGTVAHSIMGAVQPGQLESDIYPRFTDGKAYFRLNGAGATGVTNASGAGHYHSNRVSSASVEGYQNASQVITTGTINGRPNINLYTCGVNNNGAAIGSAYQCAMASVGSGLSSTDITNFYNRLRTYMTAVGVP